MNAHNPFALLLSASCLACSKQRPSPGQCGEDAGFSEKALAKRNLVLPYVNINTRNVYSLLKYKHKVFIGVYN
jgi:hypothetical protein